MSAETIQPNDNQNNDKGPDVHVHNVVSIGGSKGWNILTTLLLVAGFTAIAYQLSLGPLADTVATGVTIFLVTLIGYCFKAGILRLPEKDPSTDDLAFTKSTLRRVYDEIQQAIVKSSLLRLVIFAALYTLAVLVLRAAVGFGLGLLSSMWMAIGVGLILGGLVVAQDQIWAWIRTMQTKKGAK